MNAFAVIVVRDTRLAFRQGGAAMLSLMFFVIAVTLFPLGVGPGAELLGRIAAGVVWVAALLAAMLSLDRIFQADHEDGSLDIIALAPLPLELTVLAKAFAHWLTTGLPLIVASPVLGVLMQLPKEGLAALVLAMAVGTPALSFVGAIGAALTVAVRRGGVLLSLIVLPLYIPILIFGVGAVEASVVGLTMRPHIMLLTAFSLLGAVAAPVAGAQALRLALE